MTHIVTTIWCDGNPEWTAATELVDRRQVRGLRYLARFLRRAARADAAIVVGSLGARDGYIDLLAAGLVKVLPKRRRPAVVITDATWEVGSAALQRRAPWAAPAMPWLARIAIRAIDGAHVTYCVLSSAELETFPAAWGVSPQRVVFTPFFVTLFDRWDDETSSGDYVFAGGESLRDHRLLLDAVDGIDVRVRIAAGDVPEARPPNVTAGRVPHDDYMKLLLGAGVVVVPLRPALRSAGQQTYLNAMALGKPVIVTEAPGVRDLVDDGRTGRVVAPTVPALRAALEWVLDPANAEEVRAMGERARAEVREQRTQAAYLRQLLEVARSTDGERSIV